MQIDEVTLSGNQIVAERHRWSNETTMKAPEDRDGLMALEPQRLRSYVIRYNGAEG